MSGVCAGVFSPPAAQAWEGEFREQHKVRKN